MSDSPQQPENTLYDPPADRGHLMTEQRLAAAAAIDNLPTARVLDLINSQDRHIPDIVRKAIPKIAPLVDAVTAALREGGRLIYVGTGTSGRLGVLDASECPPTFHSDPSQVVGIIAGGDAALRTSSEAKEDEADGPRKAFEALGVGERDVIIGITAGGTTPYVWGAIKLAHEVNAPTGLITCVPMDSLRKWQRAPVLPGNAPTDKLPTPRKTDLPAEVDHIIELPVGPEVVAGSTRMLAGTATKMVLNMITTTAMVQLGKTWGNLMVDLRATNDKLTDRAIRIIRSQTKLSREEAMTLLDTAGRCVKTALVMTKKNVSKDEAEKLLAKHDGKLRAIVGAPL